MSEGSDMLSSSLRDLDTKCLCRPRNLFSSVSLIFVTQRPLGENCALLGYYAAGGGNFLPTFLDNLFILSSGARGRELDPLKMGPIVCPETSVGNHLYSLRNNPEERSSHPFCGGP